MGCKRSLDLEIELTLEAPRIRWDLWLKENEETIGNFHVLRVLLIGFTSEEQMDYDERVLMDIITELGGEARRTQPSDESWTISTQKHQRKR